MCLAIPGEILSIENPDPLLRTARVNFAGIIKEVSLALVPEAVPGQYVLVHAGIAINTVDEDEARQTFIYLDEMAMLEEEPREDQ